MRLAPVVTLLTLLAVTPDRASAQACAGLDGLETWLRLGPTLLPSFSVRGRGTGLEPGGALRFGVLAGLPIQLELTLNLTAQVKQPLDAASWGLRLLPVSWMPARGFEMGGRDGHHLGLIVGFSNIGGYAGPVYEFLVTPFFGFTVEYVVMFGGVLRTPDALQFGLRFQVPVIEVERAGDTKKP